MEPLHQLALDVAARVASVARPLLGRVESRTRAGVAPGGDVTMAIDEVAEDELHRCLVEAGDLAYYSEDRGLVTIGTPRALFVVDPIDGTRPAAAGLESCCVSIAVVPPSEAATLGDVQFGVVHEIKSGDRFYAERGEGAVAEHADGSPIPIILSANTDLRALFWCAGLRGRPVLPMSIALEDLVDGSTMAGGFFDLGSATFIMTRLVTGQLDAYVDLGHRALRELPALEADFRRVGEGNVCTNFPYDVAASTLVVTEAGGVVTLADGRAIADHPAVGSGDGFGLAVLAASNPDLHAALLEELGRAMGRLEAWVAKR